MDLIRTALWLSGFEKMKIIGLRQNTKPQYWHECSLDKNGFMPIFGSKTRKLLHAYAERIGEDLHRDPLPAQSYANIFENYARIGAYIASTTTNEQRFIELECGFAIPSLAYALLTDRQSVALDINPAEIARNARFAEELSLKNIEFLTVDGKEIVKEKKIGLENDVVFQLNPYDDDLGGALAESEACRMIQAGGPGRLFSRNDKYTSATSTVKDWQRWAGRQNMKSDLAIRGKWAHFGIADTGLTLPDPKIALLDLVK
jgi:hypothetical protein